MKIARTEVASQVKAVTVYQGRAMITRSTSVNLKAGNQLLVFTGLPAELDRDSIQVKGQGEATLGECVFETEYFSENSDEKKRILHTTLQGLRDRLQEIGYNLEACEKEKALLDKIASFVTTPAVRVSDNVSMSTTAPASPGLDAAAWEKMLSFYRHQNSELDRKRLQALKDSRELEKEMEKVEAELDDLGYAGGRSRNIIIVNITKEQEGELSLELSYVVEGPYWRPVYNVRAASDNDHILVEYDALVNQATGEDWENVSLKVSTARVNVSGTLPELYPWRLSFYRPRPATDAAPPKRRIADDEEMYDAQKSKAAAMASPAAEEPDGAELAYSEAQIETGGASVLFSVGGGANISGGNKDTRVTIMRKELPALFSHRAVPKLSEFVYLTAKIRNTTQYPLLPGKANIFFDGSFVSTSEFELVMPDQELEASLGIDEGIGVEYRFLKRFKKNEGMMNRKVSERFEYQIRVTNNRNRKVELKIFDQFPISEEKEIQVKTISPLIKDGQQDILLDDESKIQWYFELDPAEVKELPYTFLVEYPVGSTVAGI